jgi:hypothetical protein
MTAYDDIDRSSDDGAPVECYRVHSLSFAEVFRYTNAEEPVTLDGQVYQPCSIRRTQVGTGSILDSLRTVDITLPATDLLAQLLCFQKLPKDVFVVIRRKHRQDANFRIEWSGTFISGSAEGNEATIHTGSLVQSKLNGNLNLPLMQRFCNHELGDARCGIDLAAHRATVEVQAVNLRDIDVGTTGFALGALVRGSAKNLRTGETHPILEHKAGANGGAETLSIGYPFVDIVIGDDIQVTRGCNYLRLGDCKTVFANVARYGGMDLAPAGDLFADINTETITTTSESVTENTSGAVTEPPPAPEEDDWTGNWVINSV